MVFEVLVVQLPSVYWRKYVVGILVTGGVNELVLEADGDPDIAPTYHSNEEVVPPETFNEFPMPAGGMVS
jgi:hypothetical protein